MAAENRLVQIGTAYHDARRTLTEAIDRVAGPERKKLLRDALEANDAAWEKLIDTDASLEQAARGSTQKPDIRIRRLVVAEYASERAQKFKDWAAVILLHETK